MKKSDKFALFLALVLGAFILFVGILGVFGGALGLPGLVLLVQMWLRLCLIFVLPLWLLMRACGAIFGKQADASFIGRHPG